MTTTTHDAAPPVPARTSVRLPGDINMWAFVLGDLVIFGVYFIIFMVYRAQQPHLFLASQRHLDFGLAMLNTLVLLTSSRFVALAVHRARAGDAQRSSRLLVYAAACGVIFGILKVWEWQQKISEGYALTKNNFFMFYFMLTGVHLFHVLMGLIILAIAWLHLRRTTPVRASVVEISATYWHMVDLLWILIFALLYAIR